MEAMGWAAKTKTLEISVMEMTSFAENNTVVAVVLDQLVMMIFRLYQYPQP